MSARLCPLLVKTHYSKNTHFGDRLRLQKVEKTSSDVFFVISTYL